MVRLSLVCIRRLSIKYWCLIDNKSELILARCNTTTIFMFLATAAAAVLTIYMPPLPSSSAHTRRRAAEPTRVCSRGNKPGDSVSKSLGWTLESTRCSLPCLCHWSITRGPSRGAN
jgi:hypothetical protein